MKPNRASPAAMHSTPADDRDRRRGGARPAGSCPADGDDGGEDQGDSDESGPSTRIRDGPSTA